MSEIPTYLYWFGGGLGAISLASISATVMWLVENKIPTRQSIGRDLILGSILFFLLLQILPESTMNLVTTAVSLFDFNTVSATPSLSLPIVSSSDDIELRVGVPTF
jgi:hypothetical protein